MRIRRAAFDAYALLRDQQNTRALDPKEATITFLENANRHSTVELATQHRNFAETAKFAAKLYKEDESV